jgi:uncharacterized protein YndB with AHSA1/START domain
MPTPLKAELRGDLEVVVTRAFNAPRDMVWECHTKPEYVKRWMLGPPGWAMPVCEIDFRVGGKYLHTWRHPDQGEFSMNGIYREIVPIERIVVNEYYQDQESLVTQTFVEQRGEKTLMTMVMRFPSAEVRDAAVKTGMTDGMEIGYQRLDDILTQKQAA